MNESIQESKVNSRLQRIANVLLLNASFTNNLGLLNGKMGIAIFFYHYARCTGCKIFEDYAGELIDEIYEEINKNTPLDFANGLTGIGWGIEYLVQNGFLEADTDEILQDINKTVYQKILLDFDNNELQGYLVYYFNLHKVKNNGNNKKEFLKNRAFLFLLRKCENLLGYRKFKEHSVTADLITLNTIQYFLSEVNKTGLFPRKTKKLLDLMPSFIAIATANKEAENEPIVDRATEIAWQQLVYPSSLFLKTDTDSLFRKAFTFIDDEENWNSYLVKNGSNNFGLNKGLAGMGMVMIQLVSDIYSRHINILKTKNTSPKQSVNCLSIFVFKSNSRGMRYGIGTYIRELTEALLNHTDVKLYNVTYHNPECNEFSIETISSRYFKINIPSPKQSSLHNNLFDKRYASVIVSLLSDVIPDKGEIVFQMNYIDDLPIIKKLKEKYTHPIISVVHLSQWQQLFNGNKQKLNGLNVDIPSDNIEFTISNEKEMYQLSDHIISVTRYMKYFLMREYGITPEKIDVVPNGIDINKIHSISEEEKYKLRYDLGFGPDEKIILFSGRIDPSKGIFFLIDAFIEACKYSDNLRLILIGQGDIQECLKRYNSFYGKITFTGFLPSEKVMACYKIADAGVVPSFYEQCPYTVLEMMANKLPLILSRIDGLNEMLNDSQCLFIDPITSDDGEISFDKKELTGAILLLVNDKEKAKNITRDYPELIRSRFSGERMAREMYSIFKSVSAASVEA